MERQRTFRIALYDEDNDLLKFPSLRELAGDIKRDCVSDALSWIGRAERILPKGGTVFDVGGYRGITAQWFARRAERVYVFEPLPESAQTIEVLIAARNLKNIELINSAVADSARNDYLNVCQTRGHNSLGTLTASPIIARIPVAVTTLDLFAQARGIRQISVLKIDVEGFEYEVLRGAHELLSRHAVEFILFECVPFDQGIRRPVRDLIYDLLSGHGYGVFDLDNERLSRAGFQHADGTDFIATSF